MHIKQLIRKYRALFFNRIYGNPTSGMTVVGITGTDGKSTTAEMMYQLARSAGYSSGLVSTIGGKINDEAFDTGLHTSTPSSKSMYAALAHMKKKVVTFCVLELTSHGLDQYRAYGIVLDACIYTNITHEHLDYHKTLDNYRKAKASMMKMLKPHGFVVINSDDESASFLEEYATHLTIPVQIVSYHRASDGEHVPFGITQRRYTAHKIVKETDGYSFEVQMPNLSFPVRLHVDGLYNISNALAAISTAICLNFPMQAIVKGIESVRNIEGRMNIIQTEPYVAIVDFAHTPNAFRQVLSFLKTKYPDRRLIVMFGCPGRRDESKRAPMGTFASTYADIIVLTAEDPRDEDVKAINEEIMSGIDKDRFSLSKNLFVIQSREEAIQFILTKLADKGDVIAFLGKGHEKSNCIGNVEYPWDEAATVKKYLSVSS